MRSLRFHLPAPAPRGSAENTSKSRGGTQTPTKGGWGESDGVSKSRPREGERKSREERKETEEKQRRERGDEGSSGEKRRRQNKRGNLSFKVPSGPRAGSHLLCAAPGSPPPWRQERKLASAGAHLHRPSASRLGKGMEGGGEGKKQDEPQDPGPRRRGLPARAASPAAAALAAAAAAPGWRRVRAAQPGGRRRLRCRRAAGRGAASSPTPAPSSSLLLLLPARQLPPSLAGAPAGCGLASGALRGLPGRREVGRRAKCGSGGTAGGSRQQPPARGRSPCLPRSSPGRLAARPLRRPRAH